MSATATKSPTLARSHTGLYQIEDRTLFVPTEDMWLVHEASHPQAVRQRAGLSTSVMDKIGREYRRTWAALMDWLYSYSPLALLKNGPVEPLPANDSGQQKRPVPSMVSFWWEARIKAICEAANRSREQVDQSRRRKRFGQRVSVSLVYHWLEKYEGLAWFKLWITRGQEPPPNVQVATLEQVQQARKAWDYRGHCEQAGINPRTYCGWIEHGKIPDLGWLKWLFAGNAPETALVISTPLERLRHGRTVEAISADAGVDRTTYFAWQKDDHLKRAFEDAASGREPDSQLPPRTRKLMLAYAAQARRANLVPTTVTPAINEAKRLGVHEALEKYLTLHPSFNERPPIGLLAPNLFLPSNGMRACRKAAAAAGAEKRFPRVDADLLDLWFLDVVLPVACRGKRLMLRGAPPVADERNKNGHVDAPTGRRGPTPSERTQAVYRACYEGMEAGKTLKKVVKDVAAQFPEPEYSPPKNQQAASSYAKRHAETTGRPWPIQRTTK